MTPSKRLRHSRALREALSGRAGSMHSFYEATWIKADFGWVHECRRGWASEASREEANAARIGYHAGLLMGERLRLADERPGYADEWRWRKADEALLRRFARVMSEQSIDGRAS